MKSSTAVLAALAAGTSNANPIARRGPSDGDILNYALTLEHLEDTFYRQGIANYTRQDFVDAGFVDPFYDNILKVAEDEKSHVDFLTKALSAASADPVAECTYSFPSTDVNSFVALANVLEGVGVSAYLGAAASIVDKTYLTAAGSILTVEARHSAYLRAALGEVPFAQAFGDPLDLDEVYTLASPFITSCPSSNGELPIKAFPVLSLSPAGAAMPNSTITLTPASDVSKGGQVYAAFITVTGPVFAPVKTSGSGYSLTVPAGVAGQSYVVLTSSNKTVTDDNTLGGPAIVEIGRKASNMTMSWPGMSSSSPSATTSGTPQYTGAAQRTWFSVGSVLGGAAFVAAMLS